MFGIFKKKEEIKFIYVDLKPSERIIKILIEFVLPDLEPHGFRFIKSQLSFVRTNAEFENTIHFQKSKWNNANEVCIFKPTLSIQSLQLQKYYSKKSNYKAGKVGIYGSKAEDILGWDDEYLDHNSYDLAKFDNYKLIENFKENLLSAGMDFFNQFQNHTDIISFFINSEFYYFKTPELYDLCKINDDKKNAISIINWFRDFQKNPEKKFQSEILNAVKERESDLKNWL